MNACEATPPSRHRRLTARPIGARRHRLLSPTSPWRDIGLARPRPFTSEKSRRGHQPKCCGRQHSAWHYARCDEEGVMKKSPATMKPRTMPISEPSGADFDCQRWIRAALKEICGAGQSQRPPQHFNDCCRLKAEHSGLGRRRPRRASTSTGASPKWPRAMQHQRELSARPPRPSCRPE